MPSAVFAQSSVSSDATSARLAAAPRKDGQRALRYASPTRDGSVASGVKDGKTAGIPPSIGPRLAPNPSSDSTWWSAAPATRPAIGDGMRRVTRGPYEITSAVTTPTTAASGRICAAAEGTPNSG